MINNKKVISRNDFCELKNLFCVSFGEDQECSDEIISYAKDYGEIHYLKEDGKIVTMLCLTVLEDNLKYMFAVATDPSYRKKGLFEKNFSDACNKDDNIICIPGEESLFSLYRKLGFLKSGYILQADGNDSIFKEYPINNKADLNKLYEIYKSSSFYPKKNKELFFSTIRSHILYGGRIITDGSFYALAKNEQILELCLPSSEEKSLTKFLGNSGSQKIIFNLSTSYKNILEYNRISYSEKRIFALKSDCLNNKDMYINILYN